MSVPYVQRETVRWVDLDAQGIVNNAVVLTWFEQARLGYFRSLGCMTGERFEFLLAETTVRFLRPGRLDSEPAIEARVTRLGNTSFAMSYRVSSRDECLAEGTAVLVWVDDRMRPSRIPDAVRAAVAAREDIPTEARR